MTPEAYCKWLETKLVNAAGVSLAKTTDTIRDKMRDRLPGKRRLTRQALRTFHAKTAKGYRGTIGLRFARTYKIQNTTTQKLFESAFRDERSSVAPTFKQSLTDQLRRM